MLVSEETALASPGVTCGLEAVASFLLDPPGAASSWRAF